MHPRKVTLTINSIAPNLYRCRVALWHIAEAALIFGSVHELFSVSAWHHRLRSKRGSMPAMCRVEMQLVCAHGNKCFRFLLGPCMPSERFPAWTDRLHNDPAEWLLSITLTGKGQIGRRKQKRTEAKHDNKSERAKIERKEWPRRRAPSPRMDSVAVMELIFIHTTVQSATNKRNDGGEKEIKLEIATQRSFDAHWCRTESSVCCWLDDSPTKWSENYKMEICFWPTIYTTNWIGLVLAVCSE